MRQRHSTVYLPAKSSKVVPNLVHAFSTAFQQPAGWCSPCNADGQRCFGRMGKRWTIIPRRRRDAAPIELWHENHPMVRVHRSANIGAAPSAPPMSATPSSFIVLTVGSIGVVYGDIGTSPLYAFREATVAAVHSGPITQEVVLGVLSLIIWALIIVVTIK